MVSDQIVKYILKKANFECLKFKKLAQGLSFKIFALIQAKYIFLRGTVIF